MESRSIRKKEETTRKIITTAVELFHKLGIESTTMEQIAEEVDIARGTLYNYFPSKEAIINAYIQRSFQDRNEDRIAQFRKLSDSRSRLTWIFRLLVEGMQAQKMIFEAFMVYRMKQVISFKPMENEQSGLAVLIHEIIRLGQLEHEIRSDLPDDLLEGLFEYAIIAVIKPFYLQPDQFDPQKSIKQCVDLFMNGAKV